MDNPVNNKLDQVTLLLNRFNRPAPERGCRERCKDVLMAFVGSFFHAYSDKWSAYFCSSATERAMTIAPYWADANQLRGQRDTLFKNEQTARSKLNAVAPFSAAFVVAQQQLKAIRRIYLEKELELRRLEIEILTAMSSYFANHKSERGDGLENDIDRTTIAWKQAVRNLALDLQTLVTPKKTSLRQRKPRVVQV